MPPYSDLFDCFGTDSWSYASWGPIQILRFSLEVSLLIGGRKADSDRIMKIFLNPTWISGFLAKN